MFRLKCMLIFIKCQIKSNCLQLIFSVFSSMKWAAQQMTIVFNVFIILLFNTVAARIYIFRLSFLF